MYAVAIDGPSGAGKSSISRAVAQKIGFIYVDTGALYRTVGLFLLKNGISPQDSEAVEAQLPKIQVEMRYAGEEQRMFLCGEDVSDAIRTDAVSYAASTASKIPAVRAFLLDLQLQMAEKYNVIMDGRDIGTVILPHAQVKIFLTASAEERADRRCKQLRESGAEVEYDTILKNIIERDAQDMNRETAPLRAADDAVTLNTTGFEKEKSIAVITEIIQEKLRAYGFAFSD